MKKFSIIALAVCLAFVLAAPVMAVDADFSGAYRVRGAYTSHYNLRDTSPSHDLMDMRFRLQTVFKASDILSVTARFDALDNYIWGGGNAASTGGEANNVNFDRAYMTIKAPIGTFNIGRMKGGAWGTKFIDNEAEKDRIVYAKVIDNLTVKLVYQKNTENDDDLTVAEADNDSESYYVLGTSKMENVTVGLQLAFTNDKTTTSSTKRQYGAYPYFVGKFGPLSIQGELGYNWGQTDYDTVGTADRDIKELAYNLEATYNVGPASIMVGYAFVSGDQSTADNEDSAWGNVGGDWEKLFILTTDEVNALVNLGTYGNLSDNGMSTATCTGTETIDSGAKIIYGGATFSPLDNLKLGVVVGKATADEAPTGWQDEYGLEYDFTLNWKIYDNLTYTAIAAFLDAGEFYYGASAAAPANFDDTYALFHQLQLSF